MKKSKIYKSITLFTLSFSLALTACQSTEVAKDESVQKLLQEGRYDEAKGLFIPKTDINSQDENGDTALHLSARLNESDLIAFLHLKMPIWKSKTKTAIRPFLLQ